MAHLLYPWPMHLADGILGTSVLIAGDVLGVGAASVALFKARRLDGSQLVLTGSLAAFVLAAQMVNVPLIPGASAHVIGAGLLTLCLGPLRAMLGLMAILLIQALLLGDGGLTVLGLNTLTIAILPVLSVELVRASASSQRSGLFAAALFGPLLGNVLGASVLALALVLGAQAPVRFTFTWLVGIQSLAGVAEGALTLISVRYLWRHAPGLFASIAPPPGSAPSAPDPKHRRWLLRTAIAACAMTLLALPFAGSTPDALEALLEQIRQAP